MNARVVPVHLIKYVLIHQEAIAVLVLQDLLAKDV